MGSKARSAKRAKPIDSWLASVGVVVALIGFLLPKTRIIVVGILLFSFLLLLHPAWNFWWVEKTLPRRLASVGILGLVFSLIGFLVWPLTVPVFSAHGFTMTFPDFPQPLLYQYGEPSRAFLAPVALAVNLEVINNRPTKTKVTAYFSDVELSNGRWVRVFPLSMLSPHAVYFLNRRDIRRGFKVAFDPPVMFDDVAADKALDSGESLGGWVFFEWPSELRSESVGRSVRRLRLTLKNSQNESAEAILNLDPKTSPPETFQGGEQAGVNTLGRCSFGRNLAEEEDSSEIPIRPFRE